MNSADCIWCEDRLLVGLDRIYMRKLIVCPTCGNKRCPKASAHWQECSDSNASGQLGSYWGPEEYWPK